MQSKETSTSESMVQFQKDVKQESDSENFDSGLESQSALKIRPETTNTTKRTQSSKSTENCFDELHISDNLKQCLSTNHLIFSVIALSHFRFSQNISLRFMLCHLNRVIKDSEMLPDILTMSIQPVESDILLSFLDFLICLCFSTSLLPF